MLGLIFQLLFTELRNSSATHVKQSNINRKKNVKEMCSIPAPNKEDITGGIASLVNSENYVFTDDFTGGSFHPFKSYSHS